VKLRERGDKDRVERVGELSERMREREDYKEGMMGKRGG